MEVRDQKLNLFTEKIEEALLDTFTLLNGYVKHLEQRTDRFLFLNSLDLVFSELFLILSQQKFHAEQKIYIPFFEALQPALKSMRLLNELVVENIDDPYIIDYIVYAYEYISERTIVRSMNGIEWSSNGERKEKGVYFTPTKLAESTVRLALKPLLDSIDSVPALLKLNLVDPSCGTGSFIIQALRILVEKYKELKGKSGNMYEQLVCKCLFGVDINPFTVKILKAIVCLESKCSLSVEQLDKNFKCGDAILGVNPSVITGIDIKSTNAIDLHRNFVISLLGENAFLSPNSIEELNPFSWELEFPEVFKKKKSGFDVVIGNQPWGKIKPLQRLYFKHADETALTFQGESFKEYLKEHTFKQEGNGEAWVNFKEHTILYSKLLKMVRNYYCLECPPEKSEQIGDTDYYKLFMERIFSLINEHGRVGIIIPSSFSNNAGTAFLRDLYFKSGQFDHYYGYINKKSIFPIHPMFRFLQLIYQKGQKTGINYAAFGLTDIIDGFVPVPGRIPNYASLAFLVQLTGDAIMVPELNSATERKLLEKLYSRHPKMGESYSDGWNIKFIRELDMTLDSGNFIPVQSYRNGLGGEELIPLIEGRMVHQYDYKVKGYESGNARTAVWTLLPLFNKNVKPHYFVNKGFVEKKGISFNRVRSGFCDISGHQNERTFLASLIPAHVVCSNKVPTCQFQDDKEARHLIWIAYANSFVADWIIRRWVSTTLNFFYLKIMPFPRLKLSSSQARELIKLASGLVADPVETANPFEVQWSRAYSRAKIDAIMANLFDLKLSDLSYILMDFPILDRFQPPLKKEFRSTITTDLVKLAFLEYSRSKRERKSKEMEYFRYRVNEARLRGAIPYIPSANVKGLEIPVLSLECSSVNDLTNVT